MRCPAKRAVLAVVMALPISPSMAFAQPFIAFYNGQPFAGVSVQVFIHDEVSSPLAQPIAVQTTKSGNVIDVCVLRTLTGDGAPQVRTDAALIQALPVGTYTIEYLESNRTEGQVQPPCAKKHSRVFDVVGLSTLATLIEYYNATLDHYFMTADPNEQSVLDQAVIPGWARTGYTYGWTFYPATSTNDLSPVCRFYGLPQAGINSHFFSATPSDCQIVIDRWPESWELETWDAFDAVPLQPDGACPLNLVPSFVCITTSRTSIIGT
jgi:hypothetical protein